MPTVAAGLLAPFWLTRPGSLLVSVSRLWRYFFCFLWKRRPVPFFLFLEKLRPVSLQLASEELYCQVSKAFTEFHPEGLQRGDQYEEGSGQQFLGRVDDYKERKK
jgi:hypothetical protein